MPQIRKTRHKPRLVPVSCGQVREQYGFSLAGQGLASPARQTGIFTHIRTPVPCQPALFPHIDPSRHVRTMPATPHNVRPTHTMYRHPPTRRIRLCVRNRDLATLRTASPHRSIPSKAPVPVRKRVSSRQRHDSSADSAHVSGTLRRHAGTAPLVAHPRCPFPARTPATPPPVPTHERPFADSPASATQSAVRSRHPAFVRFPVPFPHPAARNVEPASSFRMLTLHAHRPNG